MYVTIQTLNSACHDLKHERVFIMIKVMS